MAIIVSPVWSSARGSIAGTTYLTTPSGAIIARQRVKPSNPSSPYQTLIRSSNAASLAAWQALTSTQRADWDLYAQSTPYHNGREAFFAASNLVNYGNSRFAVGAVVPSTAPALPGLLNISGFSVGAPLTVGTGISVNFTNYEAEDLFGLCVISAGFNQTRNFWKGPWNQVTAVCEEITSSTSSVIDFMDLTEGLRYFVRFRAFMGDPDPRVSSEWISSGIAEETVA